MAAHQKKMCCSLFGQLFWFPGGGVWTSLLNSQTTHTRNHHKQIQQRTHILNSCNCKKKLWRTHRICSHTCQHLQKLYWSSPQTNPTANPPTEFLQLQAEEIMKNLIVPADKHDTIYKRCMGPHLTNSFKFQTVGIGTLLLNPKQPIQNPPQANPTANPPATEFLQLQAEAIKNLILSADTHDIIYRRRIGPHLANSFDFQMVRIGIILLNPKHLQMKSPQANQQQSHIALAANTAEFLKLQTEEAMKNLI